MNIREKLKNFPWIFSAIIIFAIAAHNGTISRDGIVYFYRLLGYFILISFAVAVFYSIFQRYRDSKKAEKLRKEQIEEAAKEWIAAKEIYSRYATSPELINNPEFLADFYKHWSWRRVRNLFVAEQESKGSLSCVACGKYPGHKPHVDHIRPKSLYPELRYLKSNLQILCAKCNVHKSNYDGDDWVNVIKQRKLELKRKRRAQNAKRQSLTSKGS